MAGLIGGYIAPGTVTAGQILLSGSITSGMIGDGAVVSGSIASGQVAGQHIASGVLTQLLIGSGAIASGDVASGAVLGQAGGGAFCIASGSIATFDLGSGAVQSGRIASGQIGVMHLQSGLTTSGLYLSGSHGSGQVSTFHLASGAICAISQGVASIASGLPPTVITQELISGVRAVAVSQSGSLWIAMAAVSGRMPAIGVVVDNVASGIQTNVWTQGNIQFTSGLFNGIGFFGADAWVGRSGHLVPISGSFCSGGFASGDLGQKMGVILALSSGGVHLNVNTTIWSGGPLGEGTGGVL